MMDILLENMRIFLVFNQTKRGRLSHCLFTLKGDIVWVELNFAPEIHGFGTQKSCMWMIQMIFLFTWVVFLRFHG